MKISYFYEPYIDIAVFCICLVLFVIMCFTYVKRNNQYILLVVSFISMMTGTIMSIKYNYVLTHIDKFPNFIVNLVHDLCYDSYILIWVLFNIYIYSITKNNKQKQQIKKFQMKMFYIYFIYILLESISSISHFGFHIIDKVPYEHYIFNPFVSFYVILSAIAFYTLIKYKNKIPNKILYILSFSLFFSVLIMSAESFFNTTIFNSISFLIPVMSVFILFHNTSYDINTASFGIDTYNNYVQSLIKKNKEFNIISIKIMDLDKKSLEELFYISNKICYYCDSLFNKSFIFNENDSTFYIITKMNNLEKIENNLNKIYKYISENFNKFIDNYKITILNYPKNLIDKNARTLIEFNKYLISNSPDNQIYHCGTKDKIAFTKKYYILEQLKEIKRQNNLNDERVICYCQPILNCETNKYKNAEMLMRLKIDGLENVMPSDFIPIAEKYDLIHQLSLIMLNKTCILIKELINENYNFDRLSINFSASEIKNDMFCDEVIKIIKDNNVPFNKLAFEVTESTFNNIEILENVMSKLKKLGIIFYLDDFGTGYSNMDRIVALPFSVIKFDRSLLHSACEKENIKFIINGIAKIFKDLNLKVLFEGIETESEEKICIEMNSQFLQGFKYSRPIPSDELNVFLKK